MLYLHSNVKCKKLVFPFAENPRQLNPSDSLLYCHILPERVDLKLGMFRSQIYRAVSPMVATISTAYVLTSTLAAPHKNKVLEPGQTLFISKTFCEDKKSPTTSSDTLPQVVIDPISIEEEPPDETEEITMPDGSQYTGDIRDGLRCGKGESWGKGQYYKGGWKNNVKHGQGELKYDNGFVYQGEFAHDLPNGHGTLTLRNGKVFEGEFVNGILQGQKTFLEFPGIRYDGDVLDDKPHGRGCLVTEIAIVEGDFCEGKMHGRVKITHADGTIQEEEFVRGKMNGRGVVHLPDGTVKEGMFVNSKLHGQGCMKSLDGKIHTGTYVHGVPHGKGHFTQPDGLTCAGNFINGKVQGWTRLVRVDGTVQEVDFLDGIPHGPAKLTLPNGQTQEGMFLRGVKYGKWVYTFQGKVRTENYPPGPIDKVKTLWRKLLLEQKKRRNA